MLILPHLCLVSYGCPRSGTTLLQYALQLGVGYFYLRMSEYTPLHPNISDHGLKDLRQTVAGFGQLRIVFVRIKRRPVDICRSAYTAWHQGEWRTTPEAVKPKALRPEEICGAIRRESENTAKQAHALDMLTVRYEDLHTQTGQEAFAQAMADAVGTKGPFLQNRMMLQGFLAEHVGKVPVGEGRLALGQKAMAVPEDWLAACEAELADVIEREGYA